MDAHSPSRQGHAGLQTLMSRLLDGATDLVGTLPGHTKRSVRVATDAVPHRGEVGDDFLHEGQDGVASLGAEVGVDLVEVIDVEQYQ